MKRFFLTSLSLFCFVFSGMAQEGGKKDEEVELSALRKFLREKRFVTSKDIGAPGELTLSGEVRVEMQSTNEKKSGIKQRGSGGATTKASTEYDIELNLLLNYLTERTWTVVKIEFDNDMGIFNGSENHLNLERAYFGGRVVREDTFYFDIELGRREMNTVFDSQIEFGSRFDGVLFKFNKASIAYGDFYTTLGVCLVNDRFNHYAPIIELGLLRISNTGLYAKYSFVDWKKDSSNEIRYNRFNFGVSQLTIGWQFLIPGKWSKTCRIYLQGLCNHFAKPLPVTNNKREQFGGCVGFSLGQARKSGDWALNVNYQAVQAQAIPDFDANGIKRGNAAKVGLYSTNIDGTGVATTVANAVGSCNYQGVAIEFLYMLTSNITVFNALRLSQNLTGDIGPMMYFKQYEVEIIYTF